RLPAPSPPCPYTTPCRSSLSRSHSPPDRLDVVWPSLRYPSPTALIACSVFRTCISSNKPAASLAVISRTSLIDCPRNLYCSTSSLYRLPLQISQVAITDSIKAKSVYITPRPPHSGQAPLELKLKSDLFTLLDSENSFRIASISPE